MNIKITNRIAKFTIFLALITVGLYGSPAWSDGMVDDRPAAKKKVVKPAAPVYQAPIDKEPEPIKAVETYEEDCEWKVRLSPGVTVWFFDEENTHVAPAGYIDFWRTDIPLNYRVGVEGRHMNLGQDAARFAKDSPDEVTEVTYLRIPFAVEYMHPVGDDTTWFIGAGPDIVHTANDIGETSVGMHVSSRLHYAFDEHWGVAVEAGYMWAEVDGEGSDVDLDGAFVTPTVAYTF